MVSFAIKPIAQSVDEGDDIVFEIRISNPNYDAIGAYKIYWRTHPTRDDAASSSDYVSVSSLYAITFSASSPQSIRFSLRTHSDNLNEGTEYFTIELYDYQGYYLSGSSTTFSLNDVRPAQPDLVIADLDLSSSSVTAGRGLSISASIANDGDGRAPASTAQLYFSRDGVLDRGDIPIGRFSIPALDPGEEEEFGLSHLLPDGWDSGTGYVIVAADVEGDVAGEVSEANNSYKQQFTITAPPEPDLAIGNIILSSTSVPVGGGVTVRAWVFNQGDAAAPATTAKLYFSTDGIIDSRDTVIGTFAIPSLAPDARSDDFGASKLLPSGWRPGTGYVLVEVDPADSIEESREANNSFKKPFTVTDPGGPDLAIGGLSLFTPTAMVDSQVRVEFTVINSGDASTGSNKAQLYISEDPYLDRSDTPIGNTFSIPSLTPDGFVSFTMTVPLPLGWPIGTSHIIVKADSGEIIAEVNEGNNTLGHGVDIVSPSADGDWNKVNLNPLFEMITLAAESYGPQKHLHSSEPLYGDPDAIPAQTINVTRNAQSRGWHALTAEELGLATFGALPNGGTYAFAGGHYQAIKLVPLVDEPEANAIVLGAIIGGKKTLAIAFRGTDQWWDISEYINFDTHYSKFAPLISAIDGYIVANGIQQVLVSGHSLGAAMAQHFMAAHPGSIYKAYTIGSPGGDHRGGNPDDSRIVNFGHTDDAIFLLAPGLSEPISRSIIAAGAPPALRPLIMAIEDKDRHGSDIYINSDVATLPGLAEHFRSPYLTSLQRIYEFSVDGESLLSEDPLGRVFQQGRVYSGPPIHFAVGSGDANAGSVIHIGLLDDWVLGTDGQDSIYWSSTFLSHFHKIDGGLGSDSLFLPGNQSSWSWRATAESRFELSYSGRVVGQLARVEKLIFGSTVVYPDGTPTNVQRPDEGDTNVVVDPSADYLEAGSGDLTISGSSGDDVVFLGAGTQSLTAGGGNDTVTATATGTTGGELAVSPGSGDDFISGDPLAPQRLAAEFSGPRADYSVVVDGEQIVVTDLRDGSPDGTDTFRAVDIFRFSDGTFSASQLIVVNASGTDSGDDLRGGPGNDQLSGKGGDDVLSGAAGDDVLRGGTGVDLMAGGPGDDSYLVDNQNDYVAEGADEGAFDQIFTSVSYTLANGVYVETLSTSAHDGIAPLVLGGNELANAIFGNAGDNTLHGLNGNDRLSGLPGNDILVGGPGSDAMFGGPGNDSYFVDNQNDYVREGVDEGTGDRIFTSVSYTLPTGVYVESLSTTSNGGTAPLVLGGNELANTIFGNAGDNTLWGLGGSDCLSGLGGNDAYVVDNAADIVVEATGKGYDEVFSSVSYKLTAGSEIEILSTLDRNGTKPISLTGNEFNNAIFGNAAPNQLAGGAGNDYLDGGRGIDSLRGGPGNDLYSVDNAADVVVELTGEGSDEVRTSLASYSLTGTQIENLTGLGGSGQTFTGNSFNNVINGGSGSDTMIGGSGNDSLWVDNASDVIIERVGEGNADRVYASVHYTLPSGAHVEILSTNSSTSTAPIALTGNGFDNILYGNAANNRLTGMGGDDRLVGFGGNDVYSVDSARDEIIEAASGGLDRVYTIVSYRLGVGQHIESLYAALPTTTTTPLTLTGNERDNAIYGNAGANVLNGGDGNDRLDGGGGIDRMIGGIGNDAFVVATKGDEPVESSATGGTDTVLSAISFTLGANLENLTLTGGGANSATGNGLANNLDGNDAANRLDGKAGADTMAGGIGHDVYVVDQAGDRVVEGGSSGNDTVESRISFTLPTHFEKLVLVGSAAVEGRGNTGDNTLTGNGVANVLHGSRGDDRIDGGGSNDQIFGGDGLDVLSGGTGGDRFYFNTALGTANVDRILDYSTPDDTLYLNRAIFTRAGANGALAAAAFHKGTAAHDASDRIVYDQATGKIFYDADGTGAGAAILFATVTAGTVLTNADFVIYG